MKVIEYKPITRWQRYRKYREGKKQVDNLLGRDYTVITAIVACILMTAFVLMFFGWWTGAIAEEIPDNTALVVINNPNGSLNVRKWPGTEYRVDTEIGWHEFVVVVEEANDWALVRWPESENPLGWVSMKYLAVMK